MVFMIFSTVYGNGIFKEVLVIFVKSEQFLKVGHCDCPAYPPLIVFSRIVELMLQTGKPYLQYVGKWA